MEDANPTIPTEGLWCQGLPCAGPTLLLPLEAESVSARIRSLDRRLALVALTGLLVLVGAPVLLLLDGGAAMGGILAAFTSLALLLGAAAGVLQIRDLLRERRAIARDLAAGKALVFRERPGEGEARLELYPSRDSDLRVLLHARLRMRENGAGGIVFEPVRLQRAAPAPAYAWRVALADDLVPVGVPDGMRFEQRRLTPAELHEIQSYALAMRRVEPRQMMAAACAILPALDLARRSSLPGWQPEPWSLLLLGAGEVLLFFALREYVGRVRLARRLMTDHAAGRALTRLQAGEELPTGTPREFLPMSRRIWTEGGRPAVWRDVGDAARAM